MHGKFLLQNICPYMCKSLSETHMWISCFQIEEGLWFLLLQLGALAVFGSAGVKNGSGTRERSSFTAGLDNFLLVRVCIHKISYTIQHRIAESMLRSLAHDSARPDHHIMWSKGSHSSTKDVQVKSCLSNAIFFRFLVSKGWTIVVHSWGRSHQPSCVWFTGSPTAWQTFQRKHAIHIKLTFGPKISFLRARAQPDHRHRGFTQTVFDSWSHACWFLHSASFWILFQLWPVWPWDNKVGGNFRRCAFLFHGTITTETLFTGVLLPWQPRSAFYLGPKTCQCLRTWSRWSKSGQQVFFILHTQACPALPAQSADCLSKVEEGYTFVHVCS